MNPVGWLDRFTPLLIMAARVVAVLIGAFLVSFLLRRIIRGVRLFFSKSLKERAQQTDAELEKQADTIAGIVSKSVSVLIFCLAVVMALRELGFDVTPMIAGAGVIGLAVGFGAQSLVRDVIAGFFLLIENQIRVNDVVVINDTAGVVEEVNLRITVLRDLEGAVHVFPNGSITKLSNRTFEYSYYVFNLSIAYRDSTDVALGVLQTVAASVAAGEPYRSAVLAPLEILGVDQLGESHVLLKARIKTLPGRQWEVGREINRRLKDALERAGLEFPVRGPRRFEILTNACTRDDLKLLIREVLEETGIKDGPSSQLKI